jgi:hypothetical protein
VETERENKKGKTEGKKNGHLAGVSHLAFRIVVDREWRRDHHRHTMPG